MASDCRWIEICDRLNEVRPLKFVVLDGAQAMGHVPDELGLAHCDVFVAGTHKWLQGHVPMGVAFLPRSSSVQEIQRAAERLSGQGEIDDPLLTFTQQLKSQKLRRFSETVNLASLFTCRAAIADGVTSPEDVSQRLQMRIANADCVRALAAGCGWTVLPRLLPNGIVMLQSSCPLVRRADPIWVREFFAGLSISLSTYESGVVRLAMPSEPLTPGQLDLLRWALKWCNIPISAPVGHDLSLDSVVPPSTSVHDHNFVKRLGIKEQLGPSLLGLRIAARWKLISYRVVRPSKSVCW